MNPQVRQAGVGPAPPNASHRSKSRSSASKSSQQNRNPFQVSVAGSPRYVARPESLALTTSPLIGSRIPRKSPGSALAAPGQTGSLLQSQRSVKPHSTKETTPTGIGSATLQVSTQTVSSRNTMLKSVQNAKRDSMVNAHKPLPSPPALQIVYPLNSPKAQRTLIDAEFQVTPSFAEWPALSPEKVASEGVGESQDPNAANATTSSFSPVESVSLAEQYELTTGVLDYPYRWSTNPYEQKTGSSSLSPIQASYTDIEEGLVPDKTIHALTTRDEEALESPPARKVAIPPRVSSMRAPGPYSVTSQESQMVNTAATAGYHRRETRMGDKQWPLLNTEGNRPSSIAELQLEPAKMTSFSGDNTCTRNAHGVSESMDTYHTANSHRAAALSASSWSHVAGSSIYDDEPQLEERGYRTKRISDHASESEPGPLLKISDEADAFLLGRVPPLPENTTIKSTLREGSLSAITSRTVSRLSAGVSRSKTHQTITGRAATRLSTPSELQQTSVTSWSTPTLESNDTVRKRSFNSTPKITTITSTGIDQPFTTPLSFSNTSRSKTSPALARISPRVEVSPSYARSTVASSRNTSMLDQRAVLRKPANTPNRTSELKSEYSQTHSKSDSKPSRKKEVKSKRSLRNILSFQDTKIKAPSVPVVPKRSSRMGSAIGARFNKSSANLRTQRATEETTRRTVPGSQAGSAQTVPPPMTESDTRATSASLHAQRKNGETTPRVVSEGQNGNIQPVQPSSARLTLAEATIPDAITNFNKIMYHASQLPETSSVRLRGLEIAQVCTTLTHHASMLDELALTMQMRQALLASVDACKTAQIAATQAQRSARQAELSMQRLAVEMGRLFKLCEGDLDEETAHLIKGLLRNAWDSAFPLSPLTTSRSTSNPQ
ncbi:hypothetical protein PMIN01_11081 [Paraphaeosphaeria minitans]|uniref:Uncharacterized protein n=1 Tax=Paraphaeosphaeria minitans TaxID=565426 RepID=A0A9P6KLQ3_9PLEO|nr:hypothetical protein PMIN01_11081 [Paraphaeosphaeria minitans]